MPLKINGKKAYCPSCGSDKIHRKGFDKTVNPPTQRFRCSVSKCRRRFTENTAIFDPAQAGSNELNPGKTADSVSLEQLSNEEKLRREVFALRRQIKELASEAIDTSYLRGLIYGMQKHDPNPPDWLVSQKAPNVFGTPTLFLSDLHWAENVDPAQVNYTNQYNIEIARQRLYRIFETTVRLLRDYLAPGAGYHGIVVPLGGDMLSGNIHDEIRENNDEQVLAALADLHDHLVEGIELLADEFGRVFVPCVVGNHGRLDRKPRAKGAVRDNFEWILYHFIARHFEDDDRVHVVVSESLDYIYRVHNTRYLLTHGDQFRGGTGISGAILPWSLGDHRKRKRQDAINQSYDVMIFGHWHQLFWGGGSFICNGSLKGYDEYAYRMNLPFQKAMQALWITHPDAGITFQMPVLADKPEENPADTSWVSIMEQG
jgi:hypothetical protein